MSPGARFGISPPRGFRSFFEPEDLTSSAHVSSESTNSPSSQTTDINSGASTSVPHEGYEDNLDGNIAYM